jgi:hypothetical protein
MPDALPADWACRTSVKVMVCGLSARADPHPPANTATAMAATKHLTFT